MVRPVKRKYTLLRDHTDAGRRYSPGDVLELDLARGSWLVAIGVATTAPRMAPVTRPVAMVEQPRLAAPAVKRRRCGGCGW